jgi:lysozyme family protein
VSDFNAAIGFILKHEGGYVNDPKDNGQETNFGISKRSYPGVDIKNLTRDQACAIYRRDFWDRYKYSLIDDQAVASKIFDMCVNTGASRAHKIAQQAAGIEADGVLGPVSIAAINSQPGPPLIQAMCQLQADYYRKIAQRNPVFLKGWLSRAAFQGK